MYNIIQTQKKSKKLILRKDLFYMSKHNEKETSKGSLKNSNINSGYRENSNDIIEKEISSDEDKNDNIFKKQRYSDFRKAYNIR